MAVFSLSSSSSWCVTHAILRITFLCFINQLHSISLDPFSRNFSVLYILPLYLYLYPCSYHAILIDLAIRALKNPLLHLHNSPAMQQNSFLTFNSPSSHHLSLPASVLFIQFHLSNWGHSYVSRSLQSRHVSRTSKLCRCSHRNFLSASITQFQML